MQSSYKEVTVYKKGVTAPAVYYNCNASFGSDWLIIETAEKTVYYNRDSVWSVVIKRNTE